MCGFAGIASSRLAGDALRATVGRMAASLALRGPDAEGIWVTDGLAFGHRRLAIIDLSALGAQPMSLPDGQATLCYNGEIYNFRELRGELETQGARFLGHSDSEVILHAYRHWGMAGLARLEGIFAFALYDQAHDRLMLVRDRLGIKPCYYSWRDSDLLFGSEIKAIRAAGNVDTGHDRQSLSEYLWYGNTFEDRTFFAAIRQLPAGHMLVLEKGAARMEPWWRLEDWLHGARDPGSAEQAKATLRDRLDRAVDRQLISDVPVGIFLSGGLDSSAIAASAMRNGDRRLQSFTAAFDFEGGTNELAEARLVADHLGLDHHEIHVSGTDLQSTLLDLVRAFDEPFADAANIPLLIMCRQLQGQIKVVLQGDGGDEMLAGYRRYDMLRNLTAWRALPPALARLAGRAGKRGARFARMAAALGNADPAMRMALLLTVESLANPPTSLLTADAAAALAADTDPFLAFRHAADRFADQEPVQQMLLTDIALQLPSQFLAKVDRATMACGIESRVPFLDEGVASFAVPLPSRYKLAGRASKFILRQAMQERLPAAILSAGKSGFGVPYQFWLRGPLHDMARDAVLDPGILQQFGLDGAATEAAFRQHREGTHEHGFRLWKLFQLALWDRTCR